MCNQCFSCQTASSTVTLQLWCREVLQPLFRYATPLSNTRTGLLEASVPRKSGRTVHLVLLFMNSDRGFLLARCSCISTCCTFKWPVCPNLCSLSSPRDSRAVLTSPWMFSPNSLQPFLHVCSPHLLLFVEKLCIPLTHTAWPGPGCQGEAWS